VAAPSCSGTRTAVPRPAGTWALPSWEVTASGLAGGAVTGWALVARALVAEALTGGGLTGGAFTGWALVGRRLEKVAGWVGAGLYRGSWSVIGPAETLVPVGGARRATTGGVTGACGGAPDDEPTAGAQLRPFRPLTFGCVEGPSGLRSGADGGTVDSRRTGLFGCATGGAAVSVGGPASSAARRRRRPAAGAGSPYRATSSATVNCARSSGSLLRLIVIYRAPRATVRPVRRGGRRVSCAVRSIPSNQSSQSSRWTVLEPTSSTPGRMRGHAMAASSGVVLVTKAADGEQVPGRGRILLDLGA
jgi:hypothetical protein